VSLALDFDQRGRGIGQEAFRLLAIVADSKGAARIIATTKVNNLPAILSLIHAGFTPSGLKEPNRLQLTWT